MNQSDRSSLLPVNRARRWLSLPILWIACCLSATAADPPDTTVALTAQEQNWLHAHPVVTLAIDDQNPPLNFRRADAEGPSYAGATIDYLNLMARKAGFRLQLEG